MEEKQRTAEAVREHNNLRVGITILTVNYRAIPMTDSLY